MIDSTCPVNALAIQLDEILGRQLVTIPRDHRIAEEIQDLVRDIAWGRAGEEHLPAVRSLAEELSASRERNAVDLGRQVLLAVTNHDETFVSHVSTGNCATGECVRMVPAPCQMTCPAGIDVPSYVNLIAWGQYDQAIEIIRKDNPFPWVCGLVCTRPCEFMCVRGRMDTPVSIKFIKGYAAEKSLSDGKYANPPQEPDQDRRIAVIGAGPAGMSAAYYLALKGYGVTIFEDMPMAGGMMMFGIPRYRLPREVIDREAGMLEKLGVEFVYNTRFGRDISWQQLQDQGYHALFLAIGAQKAYRLELKGSDECDGLMDAVAFLRRTALGDRSVPGKKVVVIGGGNVAIDAARTCLRLGSEHVTIAYRRTRNEMPADVEEVEQAEEEGVAFSFLTIPAAIRQENGRVAGMECLRAMMQETGKDGRIRPVPLEDSRYEIDTDAVIYAIGQQVDINCLDELQELKWTRRNTIDTNMVSMETSMEGVFSAGDVVTGPATVVEAIGGGKRAAQAIDRYLNGIPQPKMPPVPKRRLRTDWLDLTASAKTIQKRPEMPLLNIERRRTTFQQVELGYSEEVSRREGGRCLRCDICLRCGKCVSICRDKMKIDALHLGYMNFDHPGETDLRLTSERCILCGACAANCPSGAMRIEDRGDERILSLCGTELNRQKLLVCHDCGAVIGPARYLDFIYKKTQGLARSKKGEHLCDTCARNQKASAKADTMPA